jgi:Zn-dependent protease
MEAIFSIAVLILSVVVHEVSHGYAAYFQGDRTAMYAGRLTMNPLKHLDPFGSFIFPLTLFLLNAPVLGWAKPVPYNPYNLRNQRWGEALVAMAGPASNIVIALIFGTLVRFGMGSLPASFIDIAQVIVLINILLAIFNLIPVPPLDGSKLLFSLLPSYSNFRLQLEKYGLYVVLFIVFFAWKFILPVVFYLFHLFTGLPI